MEHRWGVRIRTNLPVSMSGPNIRGALGRLVNVSASGGCIHTAATIPVLSRVQVTIRSMVLPAYVARLSGHTVAVEWLQLAPEAIAAILDGLQKGNAGSSSRADRDSALTDSDARAA